MMKYLKKCKHCNKDFETNKQDKEFCNSNHKKQYFNKLNKKPKNIFNCENCGKQFESYKKNLRACSRKCISALGNKETRDIKRLENEEKYKNVKDIPICKICGWKAASLQPHIVQFHKISIVEYKELYNVDDSKIYHSSYVEVSSERVKGDKNPAWQHDGKYSPYSDKFVKYEGLSEEHKSNEISKVVKRLHATQKKNGNYTTTIDYYLNQDMTKEEAESALLNRQTTFSKKICIEKYGEKEGLKRWQERQEKWLKSYPKSNYSKVSQKLFKEIHALIGNKFECFYANKNSDGRNDEYILKTNNLFVKPDFYIPEIGKIIEFDGDYWHQKQNAGVGKTRDKMRDIDILKEYSNMHILHVKEQDYRKNKDGIVKQCLEFLKE